MASLIFETKRPEIGAVNISDSTPPCTKYDIPTTFSKYEKKGQSNFSKTTRDEYGSYLKVANTTTPNCTKYLIDNLPGMFGQPKQANPAAEDDIYKPPSAANESNSSKARRFPEPKRYKDKIGPGLYSPKHDGLSSEKTVETYSFDKTDRPALSTAARTPGTGRYTPQIDSKGGKDLGDSTKFSYSSILNEQIGYKPKGFSDSARFDDRKIPRIAISDKYMKKMEERERKNKEADERERKKKIKSTWAKGKQFLLFDTGMSKNPGPGEYSPSVIKDNRTGNVKLGHKMPVPGGRGVEGEAIGDDDSFQNQADLVGKALVDDTGDDSIDKRMKNYRQLIEREVRGGQLTVAPSVEELDVSNKKLFFGTGTPKFPVDLFRDVHQKEVAKKRPTIRSTKNNLLSKTA